LRFVFRAGVSGNGLHDMHKLLTAGAVVVLILEAGCAPAVVDGEAAPTLEIGDRFVPEGVAGGRRTEGGGSFTTHFKVVRGGIAHDAMVLEAPVTIRAPLGPIGPGAALECLSAPVFNIGDGMQMDVSLIEDGRRRAVFGRYYDAGRRLEDRAWIPLRIALEVLSPSSDAQLEIRVSGGPQGDLVADWLALSRVRLVQSQGRQ